MQRPGGEWGGEIRALFTLEPYSYLYSPSGAGRIQAGLEPGYGAYTGCASNSAGALRRLRATKSPVTVPRPLIPGTGVGLLSIYQAPKTREHEPLR